MLQALDENPGRWDTSSLVTIVSSGVMWSKEVKAGLCKHNPQVVLMASFGASEGLGFGRYITTAHGGTNPAKFAIGDFCEIGERGVGKCCDSRCRFRWWPYRYKTNCQLSTSDSEDRIN